MQSMNFSFLQMLFGGANLYYTSDLKFHTSVIGNITIALFILEVRLSRYSLDLIIMKVICSSSHQSFWRSEA
jgi:hypothetical protein